MSWPSLSWEPKKPPEVPEDKEALRRKQEVFLEALKGFSKYTPDIGKLERTMRWLLFVPDEMQQAHPDHSRLSRHAKQIGTAFTVDTFTLWKERKHVDLKVTRVIPLRIQYGKEAFYTSPTAAIRRPVRGELYFVNALTLIKLDRHRENGVRFLRERVEVVMPRTEIALHRTKEGYIKKEQRLRGEPFNVWMYVGVPEYWEQQLDGGHGFALVRYFQPNNPELSKFYAFTPEEHVT